MWELRTSTSLARLWQSQGKRQEAYELLTPVYGWFTEGFDTKDLQDAKSCWMSWHEPYPGRTDPSRSGQDASKVYATTAALLQKNSQVHVVSENAVGA